MNKLRRYFEKIDEKEKAELLKLVNASIELIMMEFDAKTVPQENFTPFFLYKTIQNPSINKAFRGAWNDKLVYFATVDYYTSLQIGRLRSEGNDTYLIGMISLKESYPHIIIKPEVLALKIEDLFTKMDVDFSHAKWFSFLFYVITKDKEALENKFNAKQLNKITKFPDAEIEIIGHNCYFRVNRNPIAPKEAENFIRLTKVLCELF